MKEEFKENKSAMVIRPPIKETILKFPTNEICQVYSVDDSFVPSNEDIKRLMDICSQELIYSRLFKSKFKGESYTEDRAKGFFEWAKDGWREQKRFVFVVKNPRGQISCNMEIKSTDLKDAEIGYWASSDSPGLMTNAIRKLCEIAQNAGFKRLHALVNVDNNKSVGVITRTGFVGSESLDKDGKKYQVYRKQLFVSTEKKNIAETIQVTDGITDDAEGILEVQKTTWIDTYQNEELGITKKDIQARFNFTAEERAEKIENCKKSINDLSSHFWVAKDKGEVIGFSVTRKWDDHNEIRAIYVLPDFQWKGVGKRLFEKGLEWLGSDKEIRIGVASYNKKAIDFYKNFGFVENIRPYTLEPHTLPSGKVIPEIQLIKN